MYGCGPGVTGLGWGPVAGFLDHHNEPSGFIEGGEFLD
jgi:hypothetical protein